MFDLRISKTEDGNQGIDRKLKTPSKALTPIQYMEYTNMEVQLYIADRLKKKANKEMKQQQKLAGNPLYKLACLCGLV